MATYELSIRKAPVDVIKLSKKEYDSLNHVFREAVSQKIPDLRPSQVKNMDTLVLTDGTIRIEFRVETE
jgi:hypothetical protein